MTITFLRDGDDLEITETVYRTVKTSISSRHEYVGIDLEDRAGGHQESITLSIPEMEKIIAFYKKNVKVTK